MDTNQSPQTPQPAPERKKFNGLLFLGVGSAEVFSVILVLLLIFGTLNYFGILPISQSIPLLSFLPQRQKIIVNKTVKTGAVPKSNKQLPRLSLVGVIETTNPAEKTLKLNSQEDNESILVKFDESTQIRNLFSFGENVNQLKFKDLRPNLKVSVLTLETEPGLTEVTAKSITIIGTK